MKKINNKLVIWLSLITLTVSGMAVFITLSNKNKINSALNILKAEYDVEWVYKGRSDDHYDFEFKDESYVYMTSIDDGQEQTPDVYFEAIDSISLNAVTDIKRMWFDSSSPFKRYDGDILLSFNLHEAFIDKSTWFNGEREIDIVCTLWNKNDVNEIQVVDYKDVSLSPSTSSTTRIEFDQFISEDSFSLDGDDIQAECK